MALSELGVITRRRSPVGPVGGKTKRIFDLIVASALLIFFAPLMIVTALAIGIGGRGPVIYRHTRVGYGGQSFDCLKFRSMVVEAESKLHELVDADTEESAEWLRSRKLRTDPRVTRIGAVLRRFSVDELPQLINVMKGDMSLVGPRPVTQEEIRSYSANASWYLRARPGITGQWQVSGRSNLDYAERIRLDVQYVAGWSGKLDTELLLRTIWVVVTGSGSR